MNLMVLLDMARSGYGDRIAVTERGGSSLSYAELYERAGRAAAQLRDRGAEHVAYLGTNAAAFAVTVFAAAWADVPVLPVNYRLGAEQIGALLEPHRNTVVIADSENVPLTERTLPTIERGTWLAGTASGSLCPAWTDDGEALAVLLYTSGTTSQPKAAILRSRHLMSYILGSVEFGAADEASAALVTVPPYHIAGVANLLTNLYAGRRLVYLDRFSPEAWLKAVREEAITNAMVVPTMLARVVAALEEQGRAADVPSLRTLAYGGARIAPTTVARALELFPGTDFVNAYGLTETSSTIALLSPEDHRQAAASGNLVDRARLGSVGRALPRIEAQIRDDEGKVLGAGEAGELWVRGPQISGEYLARGSVLDNDGWFPTRDRARIDDEGYLFIEGRADDVIIRGGENTSPAEIEEVLILHPTVADVAVVGIPDEEWGQRIAAVIVAADGAAVDPGDLRDFTRRQLRSSKTPDIVEVWPSLPYTETGKLLRRVVLERLESERQV